MSLHERVNIDKGRLALVEIEKFNLQLNACKILELRRGERGKNLELAPLGVQLHEPRDRALVLGEKVGKRQTVDVDDAAYARVRAPAVLENDRVVRRIQ